MKIGVVIIFHSTGLITTRSLIIGIMNTKNISITIEVGIMTAGVMTGKIMGANTIEVGTIDTPIFSRV
jgi:hypothetical protein